MMTLHKLSAGDGYSYLTRQVAVHDATDHGAGLAGYYAAKGESPGRWIGSGLSGLGLAPGEEVSEEQMVALFGSGHHPGEAELGRSIALGREFPSYAATTLRMETARAFVGHNRSHGLPAGAHIAAEVRAEIRTDVARRRFQERHGRTPVGSRELTGFIAAESHAAATPVAGYDLTFSPVKSVSTLWALASPDVARQVEAAHDAAVADVVGWLEREVAFTRTGRAGVRQVPVTGLVATAFRHRDSRAGDPDLHTHVAVANKVQARPEHGGKWLALDGRMLFKAKIAASERYNTRLEAELVDRLGVRFGERHTGHGKRPVREVEGIDPVLNSIWSKRARRITARRDYLAGEFVDAHGRQPRPVELTVLAQQANLETRDAKHEPRSEATQRATWRAEAKRLFGSDSVDHVLARRPSVTPGAAPGPTPGRGQLVDMGSRVLEALTASRATWQVWHVRAEIERQLRAHEVPLADLDRIATELSTQVLAASIPIEDGDQLPAPPVLRRPDGASVYDVHGTTRYTSASILHAEHTVLTAARRTDGRRISDAAVARAHQELAGDLYGRPLDSSQRGLVTALATSGARVQVAIAPAGTGKTTSMRVLAHAWRISGGQVLGLAPSAVAARELGQAIDTRAETLAKLTNDLTTSLATSLATGAASSGQGGSWLDAVGPQTLIVVDEAGMAATRDLAAVVDFAITRGASVRLIGDDQQLAAVAAGGLLRDLARQAPAVSLSMVHRFEDPAEAAASLALRTGDHTSLGFYADHDRIHLGTPGTAADQAYAGWRADQTSGRDSILLASTRAVVVGLNQRARADRLPTTPPGGSEVALRDAMATSVGDLVITRHNDRRLRISDTDWVKNGDRWQVTDIHADKSVSVARVGAPRLRTRLPAAYVAEHLDLGYAATVHTAQGITVDTSHTLVSGEEPRQLLYVALSRGREANHLYLGDHTIDPAGDLDGLPTPEPPTPLQVLGAILDHDGAQTSATTAREETTDPVAGLHDAVLRYTDALHVAARLRFLTLAEELAGPAPLPWLPGVPDTLAHDPEWGKYLHERADQVTTLADKVAWTDHPHPPWAEGLGAKLIRDLTVWRAAYGVGHDDPRPTGPPVRGLGEAHQYRLDRYAREDRPPEGTAAWDLPDDVTEDPNLARLHQRLAELRDQRGDVTDLVETALDQPRPLPAENPADALWWRILGAQPPTPARSLPPVLSEQVMSSRHEPLAPLYAPSPTCPRGIGR